jgi:hypothetical protein
MRLHIVDGQISTLPHRVALDTREIEQIVRLVNMHHDGELQQTGHRNAAAVPLPFVEAAE